MRFLVGLSLGAGLTLLVGITFHVPIRTLVDESRTMWDSFVLATGQALFEFPEVVVPAPMAQEVELPVVEMLPPHQLQRVEEPQELQEPPEPPEPKEPKEVTGKVEALVELPPAGQPVDLAEMEIPMQTVWTPFRSEMSAQGFARRLSGQIDHPFIVNRDGPGRYQVSFSYANELERLALLDQLQSVTGQRVQ